MVVRRQFDESTGKIISAEENSSTEKDIGNTTLSAAPPRENMKTLKHADIQQISDKDMESQQQAMGTRIESYKDRKPQRKSSVIRQVQDNKHDRQDSQVPVEETGSPHTSTGKSVSCNAGCSDEQQLKSPLPMAASSPLNSVNRVNKEICCHNTSVCSFSSGFTISSKAHNSGVVPQKSNTECVVFECKASGYNRDEKSCKETTDVCTDLVDRAKSEERKQHSSTLAHTDCDFSYVLDDDFNVNRKDKYSEADMKDPSTTALDESTLDETAINPQSSTRSLIPLYQLNKDISICSEPQCSSGLERHASVQEAKGNYEYPEVQSCGKVDFCSGHKSMFEKPRIKCGTFKVGYKRKKLGTLRRLWISELNLKGLLAGVYSVHIKVTKDTKAKQPYVPKSEQSSLTHENECKEKSCQNSRPDDDFNQHESVTSQRKVKSAVMPICEAGCIKHDISFGEFHFHDSELEITQPCLTL